MIALRLLGTAAAASVSGGQSDSQPSILKRNIFFTLFNVGLRLFNPNVTRVTDEPKRQEMNSFSAAEEPPQEKRSDCLANLLNVYFPDLVGLALKIQRQPGGMSGNRSNDFTHPSDFIPLWLQTRGKNGKAQNRIISSNGILAAWRCRAAFIHHPMRNLMTVIEFS